MAISVVQKDPNSTSWLVGTGVTSLTSAGLGSATTTGNRLIAAATMTGTDVSTPSFSDNGSHSWTETSSAGENGFSSARFCTVISRTAAITGRTDHEVTVSYGSTVNFVLAVFEVSGIDATTPVSDSEMGYGGGTDLSTTELTLSGGEDLCMFVAKSDASTTFTANWTGATTQYSSAYNYCATKLSSASTEDPTVSKSETSNWCACSASFKPSAGVDLFPYDHDGVKPWSAIWRPGRI